MTIHLSGLGSGIDTDTLVTQLVAVAKQPVDTLTKKKTDVTSAISEIATITGKLAELRSAASALSTSTSFVTTGATSSNTAVVGASVVTQASVGNYSVSVTQLASEERRRSNSMGTSSTAALGQAGNLDITVNGTTTSVAVSATDSLAQIAANISSSGGRIGAGVLYDGTNYYLQVRGLDQGAANSLTIAETGTVSTGLSAAATIVAAAQDSIATIDTMAVTTTSNVISAAIPGVNLTLVATGTSTVTVASDTSSIIDKMSTFVKAYNAVIELVHKDTGYKASPDDFKALNSQLAGESTLKSILGTSGLGSMFGQTFSGTTGQYTTAKAVGLLVTTPSSSSTAPSVSTTTTSSSGTTTTTTKTLEDGEIQFSSSTFAAALSADATGVTQLIAGTSGIMNTLLSKITTLTATSLPNRSLSLTKLKTQLTSDITRAQSQVDSYEERMRKQFAQMDLAVSKYNSLGSQLPTNPNSKA